jgi:hypothetical protein
MTELENDPGAGIVEPLLPFGTACVAWSVASRFDVGPALFLQFHHAHDA